MSDAVKTLIITRHAHRDVSDQRLDNGLSAKGKKQALALAAFYQRRYAKTLPTALCSAKLRCQETLAPLAKQLGLTVTVDPRLVECGAHETASEFETRVRSFLNWWQESGPQLTLICSHGDWIPAALHLQFGMQGGLKKGGWMEWGLTGYSVAIEWMVQSLDG